MTVLVACEESQAVTVELRRLGHIAFSCDLLPSSGGHPEWHIQSDVLHLINGGCSFQTSDNLFHYIAGRWDMLIAFPPCTYLSNAGANRLRVNGEIQLERMDKSVSAKSFFMTIYNADCDRICIENPVPGSIHGLPPYSQKVQPYMFGDPWLKTTCLWLKRLPILMATDIVVPMGKWVETTAHGSISNRNSWPNKGSRLPIERSKTFPGLARAMATQWTGQWGYSYV